MTAGKENELETDNLTVDIKCIGADKASRALSKLGFKTFLLRLGLLEKEISDEKLRRKRKLELIREYKENIIRQNEHLINLRNAKGLEDFQKCYEELTGK